MQVVAHIVGNWVAQPWTLLSAYFAIFAGFAFRERRQSLVMARVARNAVWSAAIVMTVHSLSMEVTPSLRGGGMITTIIRVGVTLLIGALLYELGCMFEVPQRESAEAKSE